MPKCESCSKGICKGKYANRYDCDDRQNCSCTCQESSEDTFAKGFLSVAGGVAAFAGGVALTVCTGGIGTVGIAAVIGGSALTGAGATAAIAPIAKKMSGERMTGNEYVKDVVIGGTVGAVTGPIGLAGGALNTSVASKVGTETLKQGAVKLGCRTAVGAVSGTAAGVIQEAASGDGFSVTNVLKSAAMGAVAGSASHVTGNVTKGVTAATGMTSDLALSTTKVVADTASTAAVDSVHQLATEGEIDPKKLVLNAGARAATSAGYEAVAGVTYAAHGGKEEFRQQLARRHGYERDGKLPKLKAVAPRKPQCKISKKAKSDDEDEDE